jgi:hypothetical protein
MAIRVLRIHRLRSCAAYRSTTEPAGCLMNLIVKVPLPEDVCGCLQVHQQEPVGAGPRDPEAERRGRQRRARALQGLQAHQVTHDDREEEEEEEGTDGGGGGDDDDDHDDDDDDDHDHDDDGDDDDGDDVNYDDTDDDDAPPRFLQPSLEGNALVAFICAISPSLTCLDETHNTLKFASRAKKIRIRAEVNETIDDATLVARYLRCA